MRQHLRQLCFKSGSQFPQSGNLLVLIGDSGPVFCCWSNRRLLWRFWKFNYFNWCWIHW